MQIIPAAEIDYGAGPVTVVSQPSGSANGCGIADSVELGSVDISDALAGNAFSKYQYSQIKITCAAATRAQWTGVAVRIDEGGQKAYVGVCKMRHGKSDLRIFRRTGRQWTQLGRTYTGRQLTDGTLLRLAVAGSSIAFTENDVIRIAVSDNSLSGGVPGILVNDAVAAGTLSVGSADFEIHRVDDDSRDIATYSFISATNSGGPQAVRVLRPTTPAPGVAHNFLFVLPVEDGVKSSWGNGLYTLQSLDAQNEYNLTIIEPSFAVHPWYADSPDDPDIRYETFMVRELLPWVRENLAMTGFEENWIIGFSKSGIGGHDLLLKHPELFTLAASWDFPANMSSYDEYGPSSTACYGTDANFQANYRLTKNLVSAHKAPFLQGCRIWIGKGPAFPDDISSYESLLTSEGVLYLSGTVLESPHRWDGGWVPVALAALRKCSVELSQKIL